MNHSFNIITYTNKYEIAKKQNPKGFKRINESPFTPKSDNVLGFIIRWFGVFNLVLFFWACASNNNNDGLQDILFIILKYSFLLMMLFYSTIGIISVIHTFRVDDKTEMSFYDLGEKIHFSDEGITLVSSQDTTTHAFLYKEIQQFTLCFKEINIPYKAQIAIFLWHHQGQKYQYTIETPDDTQVQNVMALLHDIYTLKIPIREIDGNGKNMYMLNKEYKPKKPEIAPEIQSLIDEIGDNDKTTFN